MIPPASALRLCNRALFENIFRVQRNVKGRAIFCGLVAAVLCALFAARLDAAPRRFQPPPRAELIRDFHIDLAVVLPENACAEERKAANFLCSTLAKSAKSGRVKVYESSAFFGEPFAIFLSKNPAAVEPSAGMKNFDYCDEYVFDVRKSSVHIKYPHDKAAFSAVGEFLRRFCGAEFFAPGPLGEEIPKLESLSIRLGARKFNPSFKGRILGATKREEALYCAVNGQDVRFGGSPHNLQRMGKLIAETNPEWIAWRGGRRAYFAGVQMDFFNADFREFAARKAEEWFEKYPGRKVFSITHADSALFDESTRTVSEIRGLTPRGYYDYSNAYFPFINAVADKVSETNPGRFVMALGYMYTENPPSFKLCGNTLVYYASDRGNWFNADFREKDKRLMEAWGRSGAGLLGIYDYNYGSPYFVPRNIALHMADSIRHAYENGARIYTCEFNPVWAYDGHKMWLLANILKDVSADPEELLSGYFNSYFKESAHAVRSFFEKARIAWDSRTDSPHWLTLFKREAQTELFSAELLVRMERDLTAAEALAKNPKVMARVRELRLAFNVTKAFAKCLEIKTELWRAGGASRENALRLLELSARLKGAMQERDAALEAYYKSTLYPKTDFSLSLGYDASDPTDMLLEGLLNMDEAAYGAEIEKIKGEGFCSIVRALRKSRNKIRDGGFERSDHAGGRLSAAWSVYDDGGCPKTLSPSPLAAMEGKFGVEMSSLNAVGITQALKARAGAAYAFEIFALPRTGLGGVCYMRLVFADAEGRHSGARYLRIPLGQTDGFRKMRVIGRAPEGSVRAVASFFALNMGEGGRVYADNAAFFEAE